MKLLWLALLAAGAYAADICPAPAGANPKSPLLSWAAKSGPTWCVSNRVAAAGELEWKAAGIERAASAGYVEVAMCCFKREVAPAEVLKIGGRAMTMQTHREAKTGRSEDEEDEFPDLVEEGARGRAVTIRGYLATEGKPARVDVLLRTSASGSRGRWVFQFTVVNQSDPGVEVDWDHLREVRAALKANEQPVMGGTTYAFASTKRLHVAPAAVEIRKEGKVLGRFRFDGFTLRD